MTEDVQATLSQPDTEGTSSATMLFPKRIHRHTACHTDAAETASA